MYVYNPSEWLSHPINVEISYPLGHLPDGSDMMQNLLMLWWLLLVMMKMQLLPLIPMPWLMLRCGQVCVQSYNSRCRRSQIVSVSAYNSMVWVLSEIKSNVLQWHRSVGMFVHSWAMLLYLYFSRRWHLVQMIWLTELDFLSTFFLYLDDLTEK